MVSGGGGSGGEADAGGEEGWASEVVEVDVEA